MDRKNPDSSPEGHGLLLWVPHSRAGPHRLEGTLQVKAQKRIGMGWGQQRGSWPPILSFRKGAPQLGKLLSIPRTLHPLGPEKSGEENMLARNGTVPL